jgi:serine/threonine-protein kinase
MTDQFTGKNLAEKYRIEAVLSDSDLGKVYRGTHLLMNKPVTVKILSPALAVDESIVRQFSNEARTTSQITHPNILNVTDFGSDTNGTVYIIFEGIEGENLKEIIGADGKFPPARAIDITRQTLSALSAAHKNNVVHGSLRPQDIVVAKGPEETENVKVLNFASAGAPGEVDDDGEAAVGAVEYAAPEQYSDSGEADERSDIYSLGVIFYEMLAGHVPFSGEKATEVRLKHAQEPPPPLFSYRQDLPAEVDTVLLKALAKDPEARYQTAEEFIDALDTIPEAAESAKAAAATGNIWKTAFIVMVGTMVLAAALIYATSSKQTIPTTQLQPDANGIPVQPINPVSGADDSRLMAMPGGVADIIMSNSNMAMPPGTIPGGDGYNPWGNGVAPPVGAPLPGAPGGQTVTIDPNGGSQFMPQGDGSVILVPVPVDPNATPTPGKPVKPTPTPANPQTAPGPETPKTTTTPEPKPRTTTTPQPRKTPLPDKKPPSGKPQDSE